MICGNCHQKVSDIELYCKVCGADLQVFSSEKKQQTPKETTTPSPAQQNEIEPSPAPEQDISIPSFLSSTQPAREEKPLYEKYFLDKEEK